MKEVIVGFVLFMLIDQCKTQLSSNKDELLNWCLDSKNHKTKPGKEDKLHQQCAPWKERSCCSHQTTEDSHTGKPYSFSYNHCLSQKNLRMSNKCRQHFVQDLCFYECSPNIGPWVVKETKTFRNEKFVDVPLCQSDCNSWFDACKNDFTCTNNWSLNFNWINKTNVCPSSSKCDTFKKIFQTAKSFCENVWDHSWKVVSDKEPCMRMWFNTTNGNPNDKVAHMKVDQLLGSGTNLVGNGAKILFITLAFWKLI